MASAHRGAARWPTGPAHRVHRGAARWPAGSAALAWWPAGLAALVHRGLAASVHRSSAASAHRGSAASAHSGAAGSMLRRPRRAPFILFMDVAVLRAFNRTIFRAALPRSMLTLTRSPSTALVIIFLIPCSMTTW
jgi:hypothetical protein